MNCSRTHDSRMIDYSAVENRGLAMLREALYLFILGIKGRRQNPVSRKQILKWFHGTPEEFVLVALDLLEFGGDRVVRDGDKYRVMTFHDKILRGARI